MGKCIYCGESAGLFSSKHKECEEKFNQGKVSIVSNIVNYLNATKINGDPITQRLNEISQSSFIDNILYKDLIIIGFEEAIDKFLDDGIFSTEEETKVVEFIKVFNLQQEDLNKHGYYNKVVQASILRSLLNGIIPEGKVSITGTNPFNFFQSEKLIWYYNNATFYELKTNTQYQGNSSGISLKIMKGVYYRIGQFKGNPVQTLEMKLISTGILALTDQNIYFSSPVKNLRIPYKQILSFQNYSDGIGIQEDKVSAKPKAFGNIDGWFVYNVAMNFAKR